jgi:hypothetical protein
MRITKPIEEITKNLAVSKESEENWGAEFIKASALVRIAGATEKIAVEYDRLIKDRDFWKKEAETLTEQNNALLKIISSLRGVNTRYRNKLATYEAREKSKQKLCPPGYPNTGA